MQELSTTNLCATCGYLAGFIRHLLRLCQRNASIMHKKKKSPYSVPHCFHDVDLIKNMHCSSHYVTKHLCHHLFHKYSAWKTWRKTGHVLTQLERANPPPKIRNPRVSLFLWKEIHHAGLAIEGFNPRHWKEVKSAECAPQCGYQNPPHVTYRPGIYLSGWMRLVNNSLFCHRLPCGLFRPFISADWGFWW